MHCLGLIAMKHSPPAWDIEKGALPAFRSPEGKLSSLELQTRVHRHIHRQIDGKGVAVEIVDLIHQFLLLALE